jgi:hypothetical protein
LLFAVIFALGWYYLSFRLIYEKLLPLVALLHAEQQTIVGHLIYGIFLGRYTDHLPHPPSVRPDAESEPAPPAPAETPQE